MGETFDSILEQYSVKQKDIFTIKNSDLGIKENVGSPTFKLVSEYKGEGSWLYHIDAYRLKGSNDFLNIGGEEFWLQKTNKKDLH